ncbi:TIGR00282 family metallophosphoesterase [Asaia astilbis]
MRLLFLGDIVGRSGREAVMARLPEWRESLKLDVVVVNGENASHGFGLSSAIATDLFRSGVDVITLGNHAWDKKELLREIDAEPRIIRPLNFPPGTPGQGAYVIVLPNGRKVLVINVMGRLFMDPLDDPFRAVSEFLSRHKLGMTVHAIIVDLHAETGSEKMAFGHYLDGKVSLVVGTHTHVPTADYRILSKGTAYQTDAGMCGDYDSVIGMGKEASLYRFVRKLPGERLQPAEGEATVCGVFVETDDKTGLATRIEAVRSGGHLSPSFPLF